MNPRIRQTLFLIVLTTSVLSFSAVRLWARLMLPPSMADVRALAEKAPIVFRGRVVQISPYPYMTDTHGVDSFATIDVDRQYRGSLRGNAPVHFMQPSPVFMDGHNCIDFQPDAYWLVFAVEKDGQLELFDDCEGALAISPLLGPHLKDFDWLAQMEADFLAGLNDAAASNRIVSIQRLGGLKLPSSQDALHRVIDRGDKDEANWAVYAALRIGDISVLPRVKEILSVGDKNPPEQEVAFELRNVSDPKAVPGLIAILTTAPGETTRSSVLTALGENIKDPRAVPIFADYLSATDESSQYLALVDSGTSPMKALAVLLTLRTNRILSRASGDANSGGKKKASSNPGAKINMCPGAAIRVHSSSKNSHSTRLVRSPDLCCQ